MNVKSTISERIKTVRGTNTQKEFADRLGITQRAVVNYESLGRTPKGAVLKKICEEFGVSEQWLLTGTGPMYSLGALHDAGKKHEVFQQRLSHIHTDVGDMSPTSPERITEQPDIYNKNINTMGDMSPVLELAQRCLQLGQENADLLRHNADLRVEIERLRRDLERRDMRIRDLEREVAELREAQKGASRLGAGLEGAAG